MQSQLYYFSLFCSFLLLLLSKVNCIPCVDAQWYLYIDLTVWNLPFLFLFFPFLINKEFKHYAVFSVKCQESSSEVGEGKSKGATLDPLDSAHSSLGLEGDSKRMKGKTQNHPNVNLFPVKHGKQYVVARTIALIPISQSASRLKSKIQLSS